MIEETEEITQANAVAAVEAINQEIYNVLCSDVGEQTMATDARWSDVFTFARLQYTTDGSVETITFLGFPIWDSEESTLDMDAPFVPFLVKEMRRVYKDFAFLLRVEPRA